MMFWVDPLSRTPIYEQLIRQMEQLVLTGAVAEGEQLPSVRGLSAALSVNPNTIQKAYAEMDARGLTVSAPGRGSFVAPGAAEKLAGRTQARLAEWEALADQLRLAGVTEEQMTERIRRLFEKKGEIQG